VKDERVYLGHIRDAINDINFGVDLGLVWRVVERNLGPLETAVRVLAGDSSTT
jgi:uncharacterized protein with HEPN domain